MRELHKNENVILFSFWIHVLSEQFQQQFHIQKFDDRVVFQDLRAGNLNTKSIEAFEYVDEVLLLRSGKTLLWILALFPTAL